ncbi:MAG TPA: RluA family pseudouridine synthase [Candidatus Moranbacteria bacterium]|nr:RluA family pseudouridine synthase [Candidatus Moranbacteria bacterium]
MKQSNRNERLLISLTASEDNIGERLDKFLVDFANDKKNLKNFSRGDFIRAIKNGKVLVNKLKIKPSYRLSVDDRIELNIKNVKTTNKLIANPKIKLDIIFEDDDLIALNKPAGIQVHPDHNEKKQTLLNGIIAKFPKILKIKDNSPHFRPGIVHRLDKDTSGIIIVAKNNQSFIELKKLFRKRKIQKKYLAIVHGEPQEKSAIIDKPLARKTNYRRQVIAGQKTKTKIRSAITKYHMLKTLPNNFSLLEIFPKTGRTHQIRVHLFSIGHPIVGDKLYKGKLFKKISSTNRQMLHAQEIKFKLFGKSYNLSADIPNDFNDFLK